MVVVTVPFDHLREQKWEELEMDDLKMVFREAFGDRLNALGHLAVRASFARQPMSTHGDKWFMSITFVDESGSKSAVIYSAKFAFVGLDGVEESLDWMPATLSGMLEAETSVVVFTYAKLARISANLISLMVDFREQDDSHELRMVGTNRGRKPVSPLAMYVAEGKK